MLDDLLTIEEAAKYLGVEKSVIEKLIFNDMIRYKNIEGKDKMTKEDLLRVAMVNEIVVRDRFTKMLNQTPHQFEKDINDILDITTYFCNISMEPYMGKKLDETLKSKNNEFENLVKKVSHYEPEIGRYCDRWLKLLYSEIEIHNYKDKERKRKLNVLVQTLISKIH